MHFWGKIKKNVKKVKKCKKVVDFAKLKCYIIWATAENKPSAVEMIFEN